MKLTIQTQFDFDNALANKLFETATDVSLDNLPLVSALPDMPAATSVKLWNLPLVKQ